MTSKHNGITRDHPDHFMNDPLFVGSPLGWDLEAMYAKRDQLSDQLRKFIDKIEWVEER